MTEDTEDRRAWTQGETLRLIALAPHNTPEQIGAALNRTASSVQHKAAAIGVSINHAHAAPLIAPANLEPLKREDGSTFSILDVDDFVCRWPCGDPRSPGFAFCGRAVFARSYCVGHNALAFQPGTAQGKRAAARAYAPVHELARVMASGVHGSRQ